MTNLPSNDQLHQRTSSQIFQFMLKGAHEQGVEDVCNAVKVKAQ